MYPLLIEFRIEKAQNPRANFYCVIEGDKALSFLPHLRSYRFGTLIAVLIELSIMKFERLHVPNSCTSEKLLLRTFVPSTVALKSVHTVLQHCGPETEP